MKVLIIAPYTPEVISFRGELIKSIVKEGHEVIVVAPEKEGAEGVKELGADFYQLWFDRVSTNPIRDLKLIYDLYQFIRRHKPDVVFGYTIKPVIYGAMAAKIARVKNIYTMITGLGHTFIVESKKDKIVTEIVKVLYRLSSKCTNKLIFQNSADLEEFVGQGLIDKEKCSVVDGSGVDLNRFKGEELPKEPIFLLIARVIREKGIIEYMEAARKIKKIYPQAIFRLVGPFDANPTSLKIEDLEPYIKDGSIEYLGAKKDVRPCINECSIYVLPSYREGTSRTVLEAMAMGRPILTTDAPGCIETIKDNKNGFLVPIKDSESLVEKMEWFINHMDKAQEMGEASYQYCKERYDVNKVNQDMLNIMKL